MDGLPVEKADAMLTLMKFVTEKFIETDKLRKIMAAGEKGEWVTKKRVRKKK